MIRNLFGSRAVFGRLDSLVRRTSRYDLVLAVIPLAFAAALLVGTSAGVSLTAATAGASAISLLAVIDALFLNPPREPSTGRPST